MLLYKFVTTEGCVDDDIILYFCVIYDTVFLKDILKSLVPTLSGFLAISTDYQNSI